MTPLNVLDLPAERLEALQASGVRSVEDLCARTVQEVGCIVGFPGIQRVKEVRAALHKLGLDLREFHEDPVGWPEFPSRKALRGLFDALDLMPATRKSLTIHLLGATTAQECLAQAAPDDHEKLLRLVALIEDCQGQS